MSSKSYKQNWDKMNISTSLLSIDNTVYVDIALCNKQGKITVFRAVNPKMAMDIISRYLNNKLNRIKTEVNK